MQNKLFLGCSFSIVFLVVAIACSTQKENDSFSNLSAKEVEVPSVVPGANVITDGSFQTTRFSQSSTGSANSGIHVTGFGSVSLEPDLAIMKIGIESFSKTVSEARETAAEAMDSVKATLLENRVAEKDIQTRRFNIYPRYDYEEVVVGGKYTSKQILSGYIVSNSANVKLREIDRIGEVVDDVAKAAEAALLGSIQKGTYELGGPEIKDFRELIIVMLKIIKRRRLIINTPRFIAKLMAFALSTLQMLTLGLFKNSIITSDQIENLGIDNIVSEKAKGFETLNIDPLDMGSILPEYLWRYRPSGQYDAIKDSAKNLRS